MGKKPLERGDGFIQVIKTGQVDMQRGSGSNSAILMEMDESRPRDPLL